MDAAPKEINRLISKGMYMFLWMPSLIKEINRLISKGKYVLLFDIYNGFLKTDILKTLILLGKKFEDMHSLPLIEEQKGAKYI